MILGLSILYSAPEPTSHVHCCSSDTLFFVRYPSFICVNMSHFQTLSPQTPLNRIRQHFKGSKCSMSSTKFFMPIVRHKGRPGLSFTLHFDFSSATLKQNLTKLCRNKDFNVHYYFLGGGGGGRDQKNAIAALLSDWLRHFDFFLCECCTEFNKNTGSKYLKVSTTIGFIGLIGKPK